MPGKIIQYMSTSLTEAWSAKARPLLPRTNWIPYPSKDTVICRPLVNLLWVDFCQIHQHTIIKPNFLQNAKPRKYPSGNNGRGYYQTQDLGGRRHSRVGADRIVSNSQGWLNRRSIEQSIQLVGSQVRCDHGAVQQQL